LNQTVKHAQPTVLSGSLNAACQTKNVFHSFGNVMVKSTAKMARTNLTVPTEHVLLVYFNVIIQGVYIQHSCAMAMMTVEMSQTKKYVQRDVHRADFSVRIVDDAFHRVVFAMAVMTVWTEQMKWDAEISHVLHTSLDVIRATVLMLCINVITILIVLIRVMSQLLFVVSFFIS
jgi:predicted unusual protein kinase regulating ubiquinone biosynthesis (AarF/ABC1/UbiB family)